MKEVATVYLQALPARPHEPHEFLPHTDLHEVPDSKNIKKTIRRRKLEDKLPLQRKL